MAWAGLRFPSLNGSFKSINPFFIFLNHLEDFPIFLFLKTVRFLSHDLRFKPEELQNLFDFASYNFLVPKPEKLLALSLEKL